MVSDDQLSLCVLASGSTGNCSVLTIGSGLTRRACLIDAGLSPRRTRRTLADLGIRFDQVDHILVTHFDRDHFSTGWQNAKLDRITIHAHAEHTHAAARAGIRPDRLNLFDRPFSLWDRAEVTFARLAHDNLGVTAFRIETRCSSIGFATDLGRATDELTNALHGVGTLAIESNYCPKLQIESNRPEFLKRRIMGGSGHLSNQQSAEAVRAISPAGPVVLLHLSRQCNTPELAREAHTGSQCQIITTDAFQPTDWIRIAPRFAGPLPEAVPAQPTLFAIDGDRA